jgi:hypothetical protein
VAWYIGIARLDVNAGRIVLPAKDAAKAEVVEDLLLDVLFENGRLHLVAHPRLAARVKH